MYTFMWLVHYFSIHRIYKELQTIEENEFRFREQVKTVMIPWNTVAYSKILSLHARQVELIPVSVAWSNQEYF